MTGRSGYRGGSFASGMRAGMREPEIMGGGRRDSGAGMMGPSRDEFNKDINGAVALS